MPITQGAAGNTPYTNRIEPYNWGLLGTTTTAAGAANSVYLYRFAVAAPITLSKAELYLGATAAGNLDLGIYTSNDGGTTFQRQAYAGSTAASGTNAVQQVSLLAAYQCVPGVDYWQAFGLTDATLTVLRVAGTGVAMARGNKCLVKTSAWDAVSTPNGLPTTISSPTALNTLFAVALVV